MSSSVRVLDFFVVEATEYIDQMDATLGAARPGGTAPDVDALGAAAHRLRGSATMARQTAIARLVVAGIAVLILGALAVRIIPMSVHNWTASVGFPVATTGVIGALFLVLAVVRWVLAHVVR